MHPLSFVISSFLLASSASAVTFNDFQPILGFPGACMQVYTSTILGCRIDDFTGGNPCSQKCINGVQSKSNALNEACVGVRVTPTTLIGLFFQGKGVVALCPNFDPPPQGGNNGGGDGGGGGGDGGGGGGGGQPNTDPPNPPATSIDGPPTAAPTITEVPTQTLPPDTTPAAQPTTRWEVSGLEITIFGTDSGGIITANPTAQPTQATLSAATTTSSADYDVNNIAGSGNSIEDSSPGVRIGASLVNTILMVLCTAAGLG